MTTPFPSMDLVNEIVSQIRETFEDRYLGSVSIEELEKNVAREFTDHACRPLARAAMASATSPQWNLGRSKTEVARRLGMERTRASDAFRHGDMRLATYIAIVYGKQRSRDFAPHYREIDCMNRAGFIAVAQYLASFVQDRPTLNPPELNELRYELLCEMHFDLAQWSLALLKRDASYCVKLIEAVASSRHVIPEWYSPEEAAEMKSFVQKTTGKGEAALEWLIQLFRDWSDIFVCAAFRLDEADLQYCVDPHVSVQ